MDPSVSAVVLLRGLRVVPLFDSVVSQLRFLCDLELRLVRVGLQAHPGCGYRAAPSRHPHPPSCKLPDLVATLPKRAGIFMFLCGAHKAFERFYKCAHSLPIKKPVGIDRQSNPIVLGRSKLR